MLACRDEAGNQALVLRWGAEQLEGARQALNAARAALKKLKAVEKKRKQKVAHLLPAPLHTSTLTSSAERLGAPETLQGLPVQSQCFMTAACSARHKHHMARLYIE